MTRPRRARLSSRLSDRMSRNCGISLPLFQCAWKARGKIVEVECDPVWLPVPRRRLQDTRPIGHGADQAPFAFIARGAGSPLSPAPRGRAPDPASPRPPAAAPRRFAHAHIARRRPDCPSTAPAPPRNRNRAARPPCGYSIMKRTALGPTSSTTSRRVTKSPERFDIVTGSPPRKSRTSWQNRMSRLASPPLIAVTAAFMRFGVAAMIGAEHIDHGAEAAQIFVVVIGDVGGEIGIGAVRFHQRPVACRRRIRWSGRASARGPPSPPEPGP